MPNFRQRKWIWLGIAIAVITVLTLIAAPSNSGRKNDAGSTYSRNPDGYGAWYEYMSQKEVAIERWRKPFSKFIDSNIINATYVQVLSKEYYLMGLAGVSDLETNWVSKGNTLVIIGKYEPATSAPFNSSIPYRQGTLSSDKIKIQTTRRFRGFQQNRQNESTEAQKPKPIIKSILKDRYGAVVWSEQIGQGEIIYCTTPYLAANAYQDNPDNYKFLAGLVDDRQSIYIDEYIHGYKDRESNPEAPPETLISYLTKTPWYLLFIQTVLITILAAITALRRFGSPIKPKPDKAIADNSTAYIDALAGVLEKANSTDFVVEAIANDEQRKLQQSLGLGKSLIESRKSNRCL